MQIKLKRTLVSELPVIGWREWVKLPDLNIEKIKAKVDSGARTSSLHAFDIQLIKVDGQKYVDFNVHPIQRDSKTTVPCRAKLIDQRKIKSSNGFNELRPIIQSTLVLLNHSYPIEISLTSRADMGFRMLLGRQAVRNRFNIASGVSFIDKSLIPPTIKKSKKRKKKTSNRKTENGEKK